ncbi:hypothetical protein PoB_002440100, partial [Plakobranchus ocellatus]
FDGCYEFSVNTSSLRKNQTSFNVLHIAANVTDSKYGITLNQSHIGPEESQWPLKIMFDDNIGFIKPKWPYFGKVIVKKLDGKPAQGEIINVTAYSRDRHYWVTKNLMADKSGEVLFGLCSVYNLNNVSSVKIIAQSPRFEIPDSSKDDWLWKHMSIHTSSRSNVRYVRHWFSPTYSYIEVPKIDSPLTCGQRALLRVDYSRRMHPNLMFHYLVMARGQIVKTGQQDWEHALRTADGVKEPPQPDFDEVCLRPVQQYFGRKRRDDGMTGPVQKCDKNELAERISWTWNIADMTDKFLFYLDIEPIMSPKFTLLVYHVLASGEVVAGSRQYDVKPCFENKVKISFKEGRKGYVKQALHLKLEAAPGSECAVGIVPKSVPQISPAKMLDKIGEFKNYEDRPNTDLYEIENENKYCMNRLKNIYGLSAADDDSWKFKSLYVDSVEAFKRSNSLILTDLDLQIRPCRRLQPDLSKTTKETPIPVHIQGNKRETFTPNYPETWLWTLVRIGTEGKIELPETAPNKSLTWTASAVCLSEEKGLGMSSTSLTVILHPITLVFYQSFLVDDEDEVTFRAKVYTNLEGCLRFRLSIMGIGENNERRGYQTFVGCTCKWKQFESWFSYYHKLWFKNAVNYTAKAQVLSGSCHVKRGRRDIENNSYVGMFQEVTGSIIIKYRGVETSYTYATYLCPGGKIID